MAAHKLGDIIHLVFIFHWYIILDLGSCCLLGLTRKEIEIQRH